MANLMRLALIDTNSGYVWGDYCCHADEAARLSDETLMRNAAVAVMNSADPSRHYEAHEFVCIERRRESVTALDVYEMPDDDFALTDGQDREQIAHVEAGRFLGRLQHVPPNTR